MKKIIYPKLCISCKLKYHCIISPVNKLKIDLGVRLSPIIPFPGPNIDGCKSYVKEKKNE